jgi:hypothetical protein
MIKFNYKDTERFFLFSDFKWVKDLATLALAEFN